MSGTNWLLFSPSIRCIFDRIFRLVIMIDFVREFRCLWGNFLVLDVKRPQRMFKAKFKMANKHEKM